MKIKKEKCRKVVEAKNNIKIYNLLNHTSGLTYGTLEILLLKEE